MGATAEHTDTTGGVVVLFGKIEAAEPDGQNGAWREDACGGAASDTGAGHSAEARHHA